MVGRADLEDEIIVTYSVAPNPHSFCSAWSPTSFPDLVSSNVVVNADEPLLLGDDQISSVTDNADCSGGFHFGSIDLGQRGYFPALGTQTFGGVVTSGAAQCSSSQIAGCTRIHWNGSNTLTITLGQPAVGDPTQGNSSVAVYTPNQALGVSGTIASTKRVQF